MTEHSNRPFPLQGGRVDDGTPIPTGGTIPEWLARACYTRFFRLCQKNGVVPPTFVDVERHGGFTPLAFLDLMAGGDGTGLAWNALATGNQTILEEKLSVLRPDQLVVPVRQGLDVELAREFSRIASVKGK